MNEKPLAFKFHRKKLNEASVRTIRNLQNEFSHSLDPFEALSQFNNMRILVDINGLTTYNDLFLFPVDSMIWPKIQAFSPNLKFQFR